VTEILRPGKNTARDHLEISGLLQAKQIQLPKNFGVQKNE